MNKDKNKVLNIGIENWESGNKLSTKQQAKFSPEVNTPLRKH